jgi:hypothetical protein
MTVRLCVLAFLVGCCANPAAANLLSNPGFELPDASMGDVFGSTDWIVFGNGFTTATQANSGSQSLKMFGTFTGGFGVSGAFQEFAASPGQIYEISSVSRQITGDSLVGTSNFAVQKIVFKDSQDVEIGAVESNILNASTPLDVWQSNAAIQGIAPVGTVQVEAFVLFVQPNNEGGAGFFDDVTFDLVPEPSFAVLLGVSALCSLSALRRRHRTPD